MGWGSVIGGVAGSFVGGPAGAVIGSGLGGALDSDIAQNQANAFAQSSAQAQMNFQREMANTSYQRGMADMKAAGLNPMLAYSNGGASVPTGSYATYTPVAPATASAGAAVQSASTQAKLAPSQEDLNVASAFNVKAQTKTEGFRAAVAQNEAIKGNYALMQLSGTVDAAMQLTKSANGAEAFAELAKPQIKAGLAELRAAFASASNDAQVFEALNSKAVSIALDVLGRVTGSGSAIAGAVDRYRARSQRGSILDLNKE